MTSRLGWGLGLCLGFVMAMMLPTMAIARLSPPSSSRATPSLGQFAVSGDLLQQGQRSYQAGQFAAAAKLWQDAAQQFQQGGDRAKQALSLNHLSLAYQELGEWDKANQAITESLQLLQSADPTQTNPLAPPTTALALKAQGLNTQARLQLALGQPQTALETWQTAEATYRQAGDTVGVLGSQLNQVHTLQRLGLYRRSQLLLDQISTQIQAQPPSALKATGMRNLGETIRLTGSLTAARKVLEESVALSDRLQLPQESSATLLALGNVARDLQDIPSALTFYQRSAALAPTKILKLQSLVNQLSLLTAQNQWLLAKTVMQQIDSTWANLAPSRVGIYTQVNFAASLINSRDRWPAELQPSARFIADRLAVAVQQARSLGDRRSESHALGQLGKLYEKNQQWSAAKQVTQQALTLSQAIDAADLSYRWYAQLGRIHNQQRDSRSDPSGNRAQAIKAYTNAIELLKSLRSDLAASSLDTQFSFLESVEPIYRELVALLTEGPNPSQAELKQAREVIEALQLAELENFLHSSCLEARPEQIDQLDPTAAVIYPIILGDRLSVILSVPGQPLQIYSTLKPKSTIQATIDELFQDLNPLIAEKERLRVSQTLYDWLIRPAEATLAQHQIKTLVFVLDGSLRSLPMSVLYDGKNYLLEKYSIAIAPGLQLIESQFSPKPDSLRVLVGGLTEARSGFPALPSVATELNTIATELPAQVLENQTFTIENLQAQIQAANFPVVHLATHAQFSSDLSHTFILSWDRRITIEALRNLLNERPTSFGTQTIELLVLSACETAEGDDRAALGLAGLAIRSGARSTLASLWAVNDASTAALMSEFYRILVRQQLTKAEALRQAQLHLLHSEDYHHPYYWAAFILVGNWV